MSWVRFPMASLEFFSDIILPVALMALGSTQPQTELSKKVKQSLTGLEWPRGFQEIKVPRFHDNGTGWW